MNSVSPCGHTQAVIIPKPKATVSVPSIRLSFNLQTAFRLHLCKIGTPVLPGSQFFRVIPVYTERAECVTVYFLGV